MEFLGFLAIIAMIFGGGYALFNAEKGIHKLYGLFFLGIGLCIVYLSYTSPSTSDNNDNDVSYDYSYVGNGPNFKGSKKKCNIRNHGCFGGFDENNDGWCDVCKANGYDCHMCYH